MRDRGGRPFQRVAREPPQLPSGYLQNGYFDSQGNINGELLTRIAEQVARVLGDSQITYTQLRRFFAQVRSIERDLGQRDFPKLVPQIQSLKPMAANYVGKANNQWERQKREAFKRFIDLNVQLAIRDQESFEKGFIPHFESVVAYYKYHFPNK